MPTVREVAMQKAARVKEPYERPTVRRVKIVRSELAVTGCKTRLGGPGPTFGGCQRSNCRSLGS